MKRNSIDNIANKNTPLLVVKYTLGGKFFIIILRVIAIFFGIGFIILDTFYLEIFGLAILTFGLLGFFSNFLFDSVEFDEKKLVSNWSILNYKLKKELQYDVARCRRRNSIFGGDIIFYNRNKRILSPYFFIIDLLGINEHKINEIKTLLLEKNIIKQDEYGWDY